MRNAMMYSFLPAHEDLAGDIITLVDLDHERNDYIGIPVDTRWHEIQAGHVELTTTTRIHI